MVVLKITDIVRTTDLVFYMDEFEATATYNILGVEQKGRIKFRIENTATGQKHLSVQLLDEIDYPILRLQMELKQKISELIKANKLPL
ncbi:MAG: hypothetical protein P1P64_07740 [Treponemataceae bacterium]